MAISTCLSVPLVIVCLEHSSFIFLALIFMLLSLSTLEEIQQSEPKILRLVKCPTYSSLKTLNVARVGAT